MAKSEQIVPAFLRPTVPAQRQKPPKTYKRYRAKVLEIVLPENEAQLVTLADDDDRVVLFRSRGEAMFAAMQALERTGGIVIEEVAVVAKRQTRYEEVTE